MKRFLAVLTLLLVASFLTASAQLVKFLNYDAQTKLVNGSIYTVRYQMDSLLAKDALYLYINQTAPGSRYQVPVYHCFMPPFPRCDSSFTIYVSANDGQKLQLIASSYLSQTKGIIDSSGFATVISRTNIRLQDSLTISLYPNPAHDFVTVRFEQDAGSTVVFYILNTRGEEVYRYTSRTAGQQVIVFDLNPLPSGGYVLRAEAPKSVSNTKFIIHH